MPYIFEVDEFVFNYKKDFYETESRHVDGFTAGKNVISY